MSAERFIEEVREYIAFVERAGTLPIEERLATARMRVLALYTAALSLASDVQPSDDEPPDHVAHVPASWRGFGNKDFYLVIFDPYDPACESPVTGYLAGDLLEIYDDVASSLRDWDAGRVANALWQWRFDFDSHWGHHAIGALCALHHACAWHASAAIDRA